MDNYTHILHLRANNDANGNPRRIYLVLRPDGSRGVYDEGYDGIGCVPKADQVNAREMTLDIEGKQYRELLRSKMN